MIVWLIGPSGAGKTTIGRLLANRLTIRFIDLDDEVEQSVGKKVWDIIGEDGETAFRRLEWNAFLHLSKDPFSNRVVALGGGAIEQVEIRETIYREGISIFLDVDCHTAIERIKGSTPRPLLSFDKMSESWLQLLERRKRFYEEADITVDARLEPENVLETLRLAVAAEQKFAWSMTTSSGTQIVAFPVLRKLLDDLDHRIQNRPVFLIIDQNVADIYRDTLSEIFKCEGGRFVLESGESNKSLLSLENFAHSASQSGFSRDGVIIGVGGGVVTDFAAFAASIYMRGVDCILVPTTLLAQVDAAIGGKTAVNGAGIRNLLGTFRQPNAVLVCSEFLHTLPARELRSGFVECIKMGIANSTKLDHEVAESMPDILTGRIPSNIKALIETSIKTKLAVVEHDEFDHGERMSLNLGHTFGHALEAAFSGKYPHGEAVAFGIIAAAALALSLGDISEGRYAWLAARYAPFAARLEHMNATRLIPFLKSDKKRSGTSFCFILPKEETGYTIRTVDKTELVHWAINLAVHSVNKYVQLSI